MTELEAERKQVAEHVMLWTLLTPTRKRPRWIGTGDYVMFTDEWHPDENLTQAMMIQKAMEQRHGFWMKLTSPWQPFFDKGDQWWAGFTPHGTTGWNGRPDYAAGAATPEKAIFEAALCWLRCKPDLPPLPPEESAP